MIEKKRFKQLISETAAEAGFNRDGQEWYLDSKETVTILDLQKDDFGPGYWVNLAVWLKALGAPPSMPPKEHQSHIRLRANQAIKDRAEEVLAAFNPEFEMPTHAQETLVRGLLLDRLFPVLKRASTLSGLRELFGKGLLANAAILKEARALLEHSPEK